jgi:hypothetical protein
VADLPGQAADLERTGGRFQRNPHFIFAFFTVGNIICPQNGAYF